MALLTVVVSRVLSSTLSLNAVQVPIPAYREEGKGSGGGEKLHVCL